MNRHIKRKEFSIPPELAVILLLLIIFRELRGTNIPTLSLDSCKQKRPESDALIQYFSSFTLSLTLQKHDLIEVGISA